MIIIDMWIKLVLFLALAVSQDKAELSRQKRNNDICPPWTTGTYRSKNCSCGKDEYNGELKCDANSHALSVLDCHCMTYDNSTDTIKVGACVENCMNVTMDKKKTFQDPLYGMDVFPNDNLSTLNDKMCGNRLKRTGTLCGRCLNGYSPLAYSFNLTCVKCPEGNRNLWKYFVYSLTPLTVFYFLVLFFKLNTTSSHLHGFIIFAQAVSQPQFARLVILTLNSKLWLTYTVEFLGSLFGIWNLDFFRTFNLKICLDMAPLAVVALDYIIAVYPFLLTVISYILIELHARNYRLLVWIWKPFRCIFTLFRRNWDIRTSIIDAYATFFQLSCFKILSISFDLLIPTYVYIVGQPKKDRKFVVYFDGTMDFFGTEHLPYAVIAIAFTFLFVILPSFMLLIYPCRCFQYLLNRCHFHSHILQTFMDSLNGCYKDGTEPGTKDCRWFAALDILSRIFLFIVYSVTKGSLYFSLAVLVMITLMIMLCNIRPHKNSVGHYLQIDVTFYALIALFYTALSACETAGLKQHEFVNGMYGIACLIAFIPLMYMSCLSIYWLWSHRRWGKALVNRVRAWRSGYDMLEESLPDRLINPEQYSEQAMENTASGK